VRQLAELDLDLPAGLLLGRPRHYATTSQLLGAFAVKPSVPLPGLKLVDHVLVQLLQKAAPTDVYMLRSWSSR
jgi:hypothetical protein